MTLQRFYTDTGAMLAIKYCKFVLNYSINDTNIMKKTFYIFFMRVNFQIRQVMRQKRVTNSQQKRTCFPLDSQLT